MRQPAEYIVAIESAQHALVNQTPRVQQAIPVILFASKQEGERSPNVVSALILVVGIVKVLLRLVIDKDKSVQKGSRLTAHLFELSSEGRRQSVRRKACDHAAASTKIHGSQVLAPRKIHTCSFALLGQA